MGNATKERAGAGYTPPEATGCFFFLPSSFLASHDDGAKNLFLLLFFFNSIKGNKWRRSGRPGGRLRHPVPQERLCVAQTVTGSLFHILIHAAYL